MPPADRHIPLMGTIRTIRYDNFLWLLSHYKNDAHFAEAMDLPPAFVSQLKLQRRRVGDELARKIERISNLPEGWFDTYHDLETGQSHGSTPKQRYYPKGRAMTDETENLILSLLRDLRSEMADSFNQIREDIDDLKYRLSSLQQQVAGMNTELAHLRADLAHYSARQDQDDRRFERIERLLELRDE